MRKGLLFGDTNVRTAPELNIEDVVREKKTNVTGQPDHAENVNDRV
jgi:hypothetical protein